MPSFDVVSELARHELTNAVDQANREIGTRFDFKGSNATIEETKEGLTLEAQNEFQLEQMMTVLNQKLVKRGLDIQSLEKQKVESSNLRARQKLLVKEGIEKELAKQIVKLVKESKLKVQASIQGEQVRITGKNRDDLQQAISLLKGAGLEQPLQFTNFRD
ncbi:MAG: YajQ family cyclic di-GMP-binding protein [Gammaproteobacteria bacterium]|nr:YajQ family cyclic di-GMP-binding protein [Gammaproteobacteria bacterium]